MPRTVRRVGRMFGQRGPRAPLKERQLALIQRVPCLAALNEPQRMCAVEMLSLREYAHGTKITREGHAGDEFFMIDRGQVVLTIAQDDRGQGNTKELSKLKAGDYFGDDIVLAGRHTSTATAIGTVHVHVMRRDSLENVLAPVTKEIRDAASEGEILKQVPLLSHLKPEDRAGLITHLLPVAYPPNAYVCRQGERGETFYIILSGVCKVLITQSKDSGAAEIEVQRLGAGDFFGEMALMRSDCLRTANIVTVTPVKCMVLHNTHFQQFRPQLELLLLQHGAGNSNKLRLSGSGPGGGGETGLLADITRRNSLADTAMLAMIVASDKKQASALQKAEHLMERQSFNFASLMLKESGGAGAQAPGPMARAQTSTRLNGPGLTLSIPEVPEPALPVRGGLSRSPHSPGALRVGGFDESRRVTRMNRSEGIHRRTSMQPGKSGGPMHVPFAETPLGSPHSVQFDITSLTSSLFSKLSRRLKTDPDVGSRFPRILPLLDSAADNDAAAVAGRFASRLVKANSFGHGSRRVSRVLRPSMQQRQAHMSAIGRQACAALSLPSEQRDASAINFLWELVKATEFVAKFCKGWSKHQMQELMHELQVENFKQRKLVYDESGLADRAYIILAGSFVVSSGRGSNGRVAKLGPGESFGDMALLGMPARMSRVMSVTTATCAVVPAKAYSMLVGSIPVEQKFEFLQSLPLFRNWDPYKLYKIAVVLRERHFARNTLLLRANERASGVFFVKEGEVVYTHGRVVGVQQLSQRGALAEGDEELRGSEALGDVGMDAALMSGSEAEQHRQRRQQKQRLVEVAAEQRIRRRKWEREELDAAGTASATASEDASPAVQNLRKITTHRCCTAGRVTLRRAHKGNIDGADVPVLERGAVNENRSLIPLCTLTPGSMFGESAVATTLEAPNPKAAAQPPRKNAADRRASTSARERKSSVSADARERKSSVAAGRKETGGPSTADDVVALREPAAVAVLDSRCLLLQLLPDDCRALLDAATIAKMDTALQEKHARLGRRGTAQKAVRRVRRQNFDERIKQPWVKLKPADGGDDRASTAPAGRRRVSSGPRRVAAAADIVIKPRGCDAYTLARLPREKARRVLSASMSIDKLMASSSPGDQGVKSLEKQRRARQSTLAASGIVLPGATHAAGRSGKRSMKMTRSLSSRSTRPGTAPALGLSAGPTQMMHAAAHNEMRRAVHKLNAQGNTLLAIKQECRELGLGVSAALGASVTAACPSAGRGASGVVSPTLRASLSLHNSTTSPPVSSVVDAVDRDPRAGTYLVRQN